MLRSLWAWTVTFGLAAVLVPTMALLIVPSFGLLRPWVAGRAIGLWGRWSAKLSGIELRVSGQEHLRGRKPRVLILNHASALDIPLLASLGPPAPVAVAKAALMWLPPINFGFWLVGVMWVDRRSKERAVASMRKGAAKVRDQRLTVMISPEGTRSRNGQLAPFKTGAFHLAQQAGAEIVPVVIRGAYALCPPTGYRVSPGVVELEIKPPIPPSEDPKAQAEQVHALYQQWLDEGLGPQSSP